MQKNREVILILIALVSFSVLACGCMGNSSSHQSTLQDFEMITVTDALGRSVEVPKSPDHVICSGAGTLRYLTYLQAQERVVGVDSIETRLSQFDARPYAIANPQFKDYPVFGEFRGNDDPEKILMLEPRPQVIFKTYSADAYDPVELQRRTGIPVVVLNYGDMVNYRTDMYSSFRIMGEVLDKEERAEELIAFFDQTIADLNERTVDVPEEEKTTCYVGGIARRGPHGFQSTEPTYPPFLFINARNVAYDPRGLSSADVAKESLLGWDPEVLFVDLSTTQSEDRSSAVYQLRTDSAYMQLSAVRSSEVYTVMPYNWYTQNYGSVLVNSYYTGKLLYPERFEDIDVDEKGIEIYTFLVGRGDEQVGEHVYDTMKHAFTIPAFTKLDL